VEIGELLDHPGVIKVLRPRRTDLPGDGVVWGKTYVTSEREQKLAPESPWNCRSDADCVGVYHARELCAWTSGEYIVGAGDRITGYDFGGPVNLGRRLTLTRLPKLLVPPIRFPGRIESKRGDAHSDIYSLYDAVRDADRKMPFQELNPTSVAELSYPSAGN